MNVHTDFEILYRLLISFGIGTAIGLEREYRSKAAGLRTMIMICLGSTIFTQLSISLGGSNPDRIAASIVSGIGFLGAGVIFKDGLSVSGITTATTIWITAALGMAVGVGEYFRLCLTDGTRREPTKYRSMEIMNLKKTSYKKFAGYVLAITGSAT